MLIGRLLAGLSAAIALTGLVVQYYLLAEDMIEDGAGHVEAIWRFVGFFTILTNIGVLIVAFAMARAPNSRLASPPVRLATTTAIIIVGIVYSVALRGTWNPQGLQLVADHLLHDASPIIFALAWLAHPHAGLSWRTTLWALLAPFAYGVYALARGLGDGWYAYWFLDPTQQGFGGIVINMAILLAGFGVVALVLVLIDRLLAQRRVA